MSKVVLLIGTLDTKGEEIGLLKNLILGRGHEVLVADPGILGKPYLKADIPREQIAEAAGTTIDSLREKADEAHAQKAMGIGLNRIVLSLLESGRIQGLLAIGGGQGSIIVAPTLKSMSLGFPKMLVSTKASQAGIRPYVGAKDVAVLPPVADLAGVNRLTRRILTNAAGAISGMVEMEEPAAEDKPLIVLSMNGTVTGCGLAVKSLLEEDGYEVLVFHSIGTGGEALESYVADQDVSGVIELAVNEIGNELFGGLASAGPRRLESAVNKGIPLVLVPGSADFINFLGPDTVPEKYRNRKLHVHNPQATILRTNEPENRLLGETIARKLNQTRGPAVIMWPKLGLSTVDRRGKPFWDPDADRALLESMKEHLDPKIPIREVDAHINDSDFAKTVVEMLKLGIPDAG
jgi:uncharacterized protein (UPF0261 family)